MGAVGRGVGGEEQILPALGALGGCRHPLLLLLLLVLLTSSLVGEVVHVDALQLRLGEVRGVKDIWAERGQEWTIGLVWAEQVRYPYD